MEYQRKQKQTFILVLCITAIVLLLIATYIPSLLYPFHFDDISNINKNFGIRVINLSEQFMQSSRWFGELINRLNFKIGELNPFSYRVFNLIVHVVAGITSFGLAYLLLRKQQLSTFLKDNGEKISLLVLILFLLHPLQTQTTSYVIQGRLEGLASCLSLLFIFLTSYWAANNESKINASQANVLIPAGFLLFLACSTKELAVIAPLLALLCDAFFIANFDYSRLRKRLGIYILFTFLSFGLMVYFFKFTFFKNILTFSATALNNRGNIVTSSVKDRISSYQFLLSQFAVIVHYLTKLIYPINLCVEYSHPLETSLFSVAVIKSLGIVLTISAIAGAAFVKKGLNRIITFGYLWFLITIIPRSSIIPSAEIACDYKTYLASFGIFFILASYLVWIFEKIKSKLPSQQTIVSYSPYPFLALMLAAGTYERNKVWSCKMGFWEDIILKNPTKARAYNNYGVALTEAGKYDQAIVQFEKAISLDEFYPDALSNVAVLYSMKEQTDLSIEKLKKAISIIPNYAEGFNNLAAMLIKKGEYDEALSYLKKAISIKDYYGKAHFNIGRCLLAKGDQEGARVAFKKATEGDIDTSEAFTILGHLSMNAKKYYDAEIAFVAAIEKKDLSIDTKFNLANAYYLQNKFEQAEKCYHELITQDPNDLRFKFNLAETYFTKKEYSKAYDLFAEFKNSFKEYPQAIFRLAQTLEQMQKFNDALTLLEKQRELTPEGDLKVALKREAGRITLQQRINNGGCSISGEEFQQLFNS